MTPRALTAVALVPAAGAGSRMGGTPKQDRLLGDAPLLVQTLRALAASDVVTGLAVAADPDRVGAYADRLRAAGLPVPVRVVAGGASRQASVAALVGALDGFGSADVVLVHDAARPFVSAELIGRVARAAHAAGAASPALAVADTLRRAEGERFGATVDRDGLWRVQTPQGFRPGVLRAAHAGADPAAAATDDAGLAARAGHPVARVDGSPFNFKLTTPDDWTLATHLWSLWASGALSR